jgi:hypothetical protein
MVIPEPHGDTRTPMDMNLCFWFLSILRIEMGMRISELYEFAFEENKIHLRLILLHAMPTHNHTQKETPLTNIDSIHTIGSTSLTFTLCTINRMTLG